MQVEFKNILCSDDCFFLFSDGNVVCWGENNWGQLGIGKTMDQTNPIMLDVHSFGDVYDIA